jgi:hypothetical protein
VTLSGMPGVAWLGGGPWRSRRPCCSFAGAIHQLLSIILKLRILVLLPVSTMLYVVIVKNDS